MIPDLTNEQITTLGIALAAITTTITTSLLTLVYSRELRTLLTRLGVLPSVRRFQRYVRPEPGPRLACPSPTEYEPTPLAARNARREHHRPQSIPPLDQRDVRVATDPWAGWEDACPDQHPDYPAFGRWIGEAIQPLLDIQWDQPVGRPFLDHHPTFELPDEPPVRDPVPSYETTDPRTLPGARPRPLRFTGERNSIPFPMTTRRRRTIGTSSTPPAPRTYGRWPSEDSDSDTDADEPGPSQRRGRLPDPESEPDPLADPTLSEESPFNPRGRDYEWNQLAQVDRDILGPYAVEAWELRRADVEAHTRIPEWNSTHEHMEYYLARSPPEPTPIMTTAYTLRIPGWNDTTSDPEPRANKEKSKESLTASAGSTTSDDDKEDPLTGLKGFHYNWNRIHPGFQPSQATEDYLQPMKDSPPRRDRRRRDLYHGKGTSVLIAGAENDEQMGEGSGQPAQPGPQNPEELAQHYAAALLQIAQLRNSENNLRDQLTTAQDANRGRPPGRQLDPDWYSVARPPSWEGPPATRPTGTWNAAEPPAAAGVKPILMEKPRKFAGKHDDIERFVGDCITYFEVFRQYFMDDPSRTIVLLTSLLEGDAEDWWVHKRPDYWHIPHWNDADFNQGPRYRYPDWVTFIWEFHEEFRDAAVEETHERKMGEIKMAGKTATKFFREIEREAKLANRREDTGPCGTMVRAVRQGIPGSYARIIANIGLGVPQDYDDWKERVIQMYKQREIQDAYEKAHGLDSRGHDHQKKPNPRQKQITAPNNNNARGATSSSSGNQSGWGSGSKMAAVKTKTYGGMGEPMQIDRKKYMSEGRCFNCDEKGHISKNCPKPKKQMVRAMEVIEEPKPETTKIEEVKE
ncbi:hypothetical protein ARMGADRAFT_1070980 [Armillaria gallica]|uniref:CCHC-type domain-containing protein n=1 Tax=Armillaria gallica TaxID=47427 RepID=A0A2H3EEX9_ARMGA|nr:hypothetical protein ARMGADRAFT_1070980 [Armillaria gallica]